MFGAFVQIITHLVDGVFVLWGCRLLELTLWQGCCHGFGFDEEYFVYNRRGDWWTLKIHVSLWSSFIQQKNSVVLLQFSAPQIGSNTLKQKHKQTLA